jgi:hypothetical protein
MYIGLHVKCPLFLSGFFETLIFLDTFPKNTHVSNFVKIHPVRAEVFHVERQIGGRTDVTKLTVAFRNFGNARKKKGHRVGEVTDAVFITGN